MSKTVDIIVGTGLDQKARKSHLKEQEIDLGRLEERMEPELNRDA